VRSLSVKFQLLEKNKRHAERYLRRLVSLKRNTKESIKIGIPSSSTLHTLERDGKGNVIENSGSGVTMLEVAAANEFGAPGAHIPERSFLRSTVTKNKNKYKKLGVDLVKKIVKNPSKEEYMTGAGKIGLTAVNDVRETMVNLMDPPNAESTQLKKGRSLGKGEKVNNPLIDTGQLKQSITYVVDNKNYK